MPPARSHIRELVTAYLDRHPGERPALGPLLEALDVPSEITSRATLPGHITCSAVVIDHAGRVLHVRHNASGGLLLAPGGHGEPDDATLMATAVREVHEETGIPPGLLRQSAAFCHEPADIDIHAIDANPAKGEPAHLHYDFRFVFRLVPPRRRNGPAGRGGLRGRLAAARPGHLPHAAGEAPRRGPERRPGAGQRLRDHPRRGWLVHARSMTSRARARHPDDGRSGAPLLVERAGQLRTRPRLCGSPAAGPTTTPWAPTSATNGRRTASGGQSPGVALRVEVTVQASGSPNPYSAAYSAKAWSS
ncbi:NUDIX hydrolase [Streptomyces griseus]|uniref:NUDIX hydrolase n=1 Tax=Streptomyces griseus TaxID=1911 RepID=UPI0009456D58|nr:NUDIX domain-containing protein [Streptomyces griseus]